MAMGLQKPKAARLGLQRNLSDKSYDRVHPNWVPIEVQQFGMQRLLPVTCLTKQCFYTSESTVKTEDFAFVILFAITDLDTLEAGLEISGDA